jgi:2,4-dienoyl-CoA reductase-like NADH-dependent reductase (Old Yellow Enzyme family)
MEDSDIGTELGSWDEESTIQLAKMLPDLGVDLLDVSSGGNHHQARFNVFDGGQKHVEIARRIKQSLMAQGNDLLIGTVGMITEPQQARDLVQRNLQGEPGVDVISLGRQFLREPDWVLKAAAETGVDVIWPAQIERVRPTAISRI